MVSQGKRSLSPVKKLYHGRQQAWFHGGFSQEGINSPKTSRALFSSPKLILQFLQGLEQDELQAAGGGVSSSMIP